MATIERVLMTGDGLGCTYPQPGWVVLDAIRDIGFTGRVTLGGSPAVRVFADQGDIYWAESVDAPSVGARLVDAGALTAVQLERGAVRHDGVERLERLFDRVPAVERDDVLVVMRAMAESSLAVIARQTLASSVVEPYIHHTSGIHLWNIKHPVARRNDGARAAMWAPPQHTAHRPDDQHGSRSVSTAATVIHSGERNVVDPAGNASANADPATGDVGPADSADQPVQDEHAPVSVSGSTGHPTPADDVSSAPQSGGPVQAAPAASAAHMNAPTAAQPADEAADVVSNLGAGADVHGASGGDAHVEGSTVDWSAPPTPAAPPADDDFSLVWNDFPVEPEPAAKPDARPTPTPPPAAAPRRGGAGSARPSGAMRPLGDEFEVKWPAGPPTAPNSAVAPRTLSESRGAAVLQLDRRLATDDAPDNTDDRVDTGDAGAAGEPHDAVAEALNDLIASVDRDFETSRSSVTASAVGEPDALSADELIAVRGAIASADTGLLDARRRLVEHRLRDRSSRGSSDSLRSTAVSGDVDESAVSDDRDDLDHLEGGSPALRRIMGNLRRN